MSKEADSIISKLIAKGKNYDGDTVYDKPHGHPNRKGFRMTGFDTPEVTKNHPNADLAKNALSALFRNGAKAETTGEFGTHDRELTDVVDEEGNNLSSEMIASGLASPTGFSNEREMESEKYGNIRQAFGEERSSNPVLASYGNKRESIDDMIKLIGRRSIKNNKGSPSSRKSKRLPEVLRRKYLWAS